MPKRSTRINPDKINRSQGLSAIRKAAAQYESKAEFARKTGLSKSTVYRWTKPGARSLPSQDAKIRAAKALNRIHYVPPRQPPRHKAYNREEITKIAVWSTAAGPGAIESSKLSEAKIARAAEAILTGGATPHIAGDNIETVRMRFVQYVQEHQSEGASATMQNAGSDFYNRFRDQIGLNAPEEFSAAWGNEMKTLLSDLNYQIDSVVVDDLPEIDPKDERRQGQYNTAQPASFAQVFTFILGFDKKSVLGYFSIGIDTKTGNVSIWQSVPQSQESIDRKRARDRERRRQSRSREHRGA